MLIIVLSLFCQLDTFEINYDTNGNFDVTFSTTTPLSYKNIDAFFHENGEKYSLRDNSLTIVRNEIIESLSDTLGDHSIKRIQTKNDHGRNRKKCQKVK